MQAVLSIERAAEIVGGRVVRPGQRDELRRVMPVQDAAQDAITFVSKPRLLEHLASSEAAAVLVRPETFANNPDAFASQLAIIEVASPYVAYAKIAQALAGRVPRPEGIHPSAVVEASARVHEPAFIGPFVYVGEGAEIGSGAVLYPGVHVEAGAKVGAASVLYNHVVVRHDCTVGAHCILHPGVVIGSDGFGFAQEVSASGLTHHKIPQIGQVEIEDDVEIGANSCVDRGAMGPTRIGAGTKIDNLVQVAHNVQIGRACILVGQCGIAGSATLGDNVTMAAQSGVAGHLTVGDGALVYGQSGVTSDVAARTKVAGTPATKANDYFRNSVRITRLGALEARVKKLERKDPEDPR